MGLKIASQDKQIEAARQFNEEVFNFQPFKFQPFKFSNFQPFQFHSSCAAPVGGQPI